MDLDTADKLASVLSAGLAGISLLLTLAALWITLADRRERRRSDELLRMLMSQTRAPAPELAANPPVDGPVRPWNAVATASAQDQPPDMPASAPANPPQAPSPFVPPRHEWVPSADLRPSPGYGHSPGADPYPAAEEDVEQEDVEYAERDDVSGYDQGYAPPAIDEETPPAGQPLPPPPWSETTQSVPLPPSQPQPAGPAPASPQVPWGQPAYGEAPRMPAPPALRPAPRSRRGAVVALLAAAATSATLSAVLFVVL
ncbi:hypothetical protein HUO13_36435 [Saccharopolyspora erythraea]|uniref:hypothetical protein n=1 Tax=Saccharopolyspora erythraea TaxID=1836 RepID=UPI001BAAA8CC|nr:hypothetical protein [Saccharopolyspora erythraea]QUH05541.1 hypothetical protein HUO13_36435 [Saccharopolyspora erythraea]